MAIGERIHFFRILRGMTQKYLGTAVGFPERSADVRLAQYETGSRKPKADLTAALAQVLSMFPTLTAISVLCTPYLPLKIFTVLPSVKQTGKSV